MLLENIKKKKALLKYLCRIIVSHLLFLCIKPYTFGNHRIASTTPDIEGHLEPAQKDQSYVHRSVLGKVRRRSRLEKENLSVKKFSFLKGDICKYCSYPNQVKELIKFHIVLRKFTNKACPSQGSIQCLK